MKEFCQKIQLQFLSPVSLDGIYHTEAYLTADDAIQLQEEIQNSTAGTAYDQSLRITIDSDSNDIVRKCSGQRRPVIVVLTDKCDCYIWGSRLVPVMMDVTPHLNKLVVNFSCFSQRPVAGCKVL